MQCPVPGCSNDNFINGSEFCQGCGVFEDDLPSVMHYTALYELFMEHPRETFEDAKGSLCDLFTPLKHISSEGLSDFVNYVSQFYNSVSGFRRGHPTIRFFRCWSCDLYSGQEQRPLMPPEKFTHSTMANEYLMGRRDDYSVHEKKREAYYDAKFRLASFRMNVDTLESYMRRTLPNNVNPDVWVGTFRSVQERQSREEAALERKVTEAEKEMSRYPERPLPGKHLPCPNCNTHYPFVLRPDMDRRYFDRGAYLHTAKTFIEYSLWGDETPCDEFGKLSPSEQVRRALEYAALDCEVLLSPIYIETVENKFKHKWKLLDETRPALIKFAKKKGW